MNPKTHRVNNFWLKFLYLGFIFFLYFSSSLLLYWISSEAKSLVILEIAFENFTF